MVIFRKSHSHFSKVPQSRQFLIYFLRINKLFFEKNKLKILTGKAISANYCISAG